MRNSSKKKKNSKIRKFIRNTKIRGELLNRKVKREIADLRGLQKLRKMDKELGDEVIKSRFPVTTALVGLGGALGAAIALRGGAAIAPSLLTKAGRANARKIASAPVEAFKNRNSAAIYDSIGDVKRYKRAKVEREMKPIALGFYGRYDKKGRLLEIIQG
jgi:hypothetical protein